MQMQSDPAAPNKISNFLKALQGASSEETGFRSGFTSKEINEQQSTPQSCVKYYHLGCSFLSTGRSSPCVSAEIKASSSFLPPCLSLPQSSLENTFFTSKILLCVDYTGGKGWPKELKAEMGWGWGKASSSPGPLWALLTSRGMAELNFARCGNEPHK